MNHFTFNGHSTSEYGLLVTGLATYGSPARRVERVSVPGRNGDVLLDEGTFDNYIARYQIAIIDNFKVNARAIANWLLSSRGYSELTDTYNPETYRMASFYSNIDYVVTALSREGTATIEFDCKPQRYFYTNTPITFTANAYIGTLDIGNIPNTAEAPLSLTLKGNTSQDGTPTPSSPIAVQSVFGDNVVTVCGKNLLGLVEGTYTNNGVTAKVNGGVVYISGTGATSVSLIYIPLILPIPQSVGTIAKTQNPIGTYTGLQTSLRDRGHNSVGVWSNNGGNTYTSMTGTAVEFLIQVNVGTSVNCTITPMIEKGNTYSAYEPYTAQDYPITLPVENYTEITEEKIAKPSWYTGEWRGTALYENGIAVTRTYTSGGAGGFWASIKADTYTLSMTVANSESANGYRLYVSYNNGGTNVAIVNNVAVSLVNNQLIYTFNMPIDSEVVIRPTPSTFNTGYTETDFVDIQLEKGSKANAYHPHGTTPIELNKIGTYQDYFYYDDGWYLHKEIAEVNLGTLSWAYNSQYLMFYATVNGQVNVSNEKVGLCTDYPSVTYWISNTEWANNDKIMNNYGGSDKTVRIKDTDYTDATTFKTSVDGTILYYALATPTETLIENNTLINQLDAIAEATSYKGSTNIAQTNNDLPFNLDVTAMTSGTLTAEHNAEPIITVNSTGSIYVNGNYLKVLSAPITINSKTMQAYSGNVLKNNDVEGDFPLFNEGDNEVSSDVDLTIIPNYWEL